MVIGVDHVIITARKPKHLQCAIRNDLIGIHIDTGTRTTLELINWKLIHAGSISQNIVTSRNNSLCGLSADHMEFTICQGAGLFHLDDCADHLRNLVDCPTTDLIVLKGAKRVDSPVCLIRNFSRTQQIFFDSCHL